MINNLRFEKWNGETLKKSEKDMLISKLPKWIHPFIPEINSKNVTLVLHIDQQDRLHYHFESLDSDLNFRMQMASEKMF